VLVGVLFQQFSLLKNVSAQTAPVADRALVYIELMLLETGGGESRILAALFTARKRPTRFLRRREVCLWRMRRRFRLRVHLREVLSGLCAGFEEAKAQVTEKVPVRLLDVLRHQVLLGEDFETHAALEQQSLRHSPERPT
jgi:hypothetical protein